jgi:cell division cycle 20-like protein 1 (cofactor of APC complex)
MLTTVNQGCWENMQENTAPHNLVSLFSSPDMQNDLKTLKSRRVSKVPFKVLDAPQLQDDFYLNLVDWSSTNVLAVGLLDAVYIWSACTN